MEVKYERTELVANKIIAKNKDKIVKKVFENINGIEVVDIGIKKISSSATTYYSHFWARIIFEIKTITNNEPTSFEFDFYILTRSTGIILAEEATDQDISKYFDISKSEEKEILKTFIADIVEAYPGVFYDNFTIPALSRIFEEGLLTAEQFPEKIRAKYYEKYQMAYFLPKDVRDVFVF